MARIAFVQNLVFEYLGTMYLSSVLKNKGHKVNVFIDQGRHLYKMIGEIKNFNPDIIGFSCTTGVHLWGVKAAGLLKKEFSNVKIIFGGPHSTFFPEIINEPSVDIICRGEGEYALLELADKIDSGKDYHSILNLWVKKDGVIFKNEIRPLIANLDELPFPDRSLYIRKHPSLNKSQKKFIVGRGCPFSCSYCFNPSLRELYKGKGSYVRLRNVENVIREIKEVKNEYRTKLFYIQDDTFAFNKRWALDFLEQYKKEVKIPFICPIRADLIDEEIVKNLKQAGCQNVFFGLESGSENIRNFILKKQITDEQIYKTANLLRKYRIGFRTYNMFGSPNESLQDAFKTIELNIKIKTDYPWSSLLQPFPGTELGEYVKQNNIFEGDFSRFDMSFFKKSNIKLKDKKEIENLHKLFFFAVKFPFLLPLIKWAIRRECTLLYETLFLVGYMYSFKRSEGITWSETVCMGLNNLHNFFFSRYRCQ